MATAKLGVTSFNDDAAAGFSVLALWPVLSGPRPERALAPASGNAMNAASASCHLQLRTATEWALSPLGAHAESTYAAVCYQCHVVTLGLVRRRGALRHFSVFGANRDPLILSQRGRREVNMSITPCQKCAELINGSVPTRHSALIRSGRVASVGHHGSRDDEYIYICKTCGARFIDDSCGTWPEQGPR